MCLIRSTKCTWKSGRVFLEKPFPSQYEITDTNGANLIHSRFYFEFRNNEKMQLPISKTRGKSHCLNNYNVIIPPNFLLVGKKRTSHWLSHGCLVHLNKTVTGTHKRYQMFSSSLFLRSFLTSSSLELGLTGSG